MPSVHASFLASNALIADGRGDILRATRDWVAKQLKDAAWTLPDGVPSIAATSYAVLTLASDREWRKLYFDEVTRGVAYLKSADHTRTVEVEREVSGDFQYNFHHYTLPFAIMALLAGGEPITSSTVMGMTERLYSGHFSRGTGGWSEQSQHRPSVFATAHTITALEVLTSYLSTAVYLELGQQRRNGDVTNRVFVVHGHDTIRSEIARFLERIGCKPILLEETIIPGASTIFDAFLKYSEDADYAIVLLTPDDRADDGHGGVSARARQNVLVEFGYFMGRLGRDRVCVAKKGSVEIPSDIVGVLYVNLDDGAWKLSVAQKLKAAGLKVDLSRLLA